MEVKPGAIPDGWTSAPLGQLCGRITTGKLDANAMVEDGEYPFFTCARESYRINRYAFDAEALLVSGNGANVGYVHYYKGKFNAYQRTYVLSDFTVDVHFLKMFLDRNLQDRIRVEVNAGNTPYVTMGTLAEMEVVLPSDAAEQRAIATALSDVDGLLGGLDRLITKKRDLKQAAMQQLLTGQTRLPGFHGEWEVKRLGDVAQADWGNTSITKDTYQDHGYAAFSASGQDGYVSWFEHDGPGVVISAIGAQCGKTWLALGRWTPIKNTIWFKGNGHDACTEFLYWKTWDREFWPKSGQAQPFVSVGSVRNAFVTVPRTLAEQTAIAEVLTDMDAELAVLEQRREKTHALKQAMMQELLTGRIRLV